MSNSEQEVLTQPQRIELEKALRALVMAGTLDQMLYRDVLVSIGFYNTGVRVQWLGIYDEVYYIGLSEDEQKVFKVAPYVDESN